MSDIVWSNKGISKKGRECHSTHNSLGGEDVLVVTPEDRETVLAIFELLSELSANKKAFAQVTVIHEEDSIYLAAIPEQGAWSKNKQGAYRIDYLKYDQQQHQIESIRRDILIRVINSAITKTLGRDKGNEFEELALKYNGDNFLSYLFGVRANRGLLTGLRSLTEANKLKPR